MNFQYKIVSTEYDPKDPLPTYSDLIKGKEIDQEGQKLLTGGKVHPMLLDFASDAGIKKQVAQSDYSPMNKVFIAYCPKKVPVS
jgi:hypothetical protein